MNLLRFVTLAAVTLSYLVQTTLGACATGLTMCPVTSWMYTSPTFACTDTTVDNSNCGSCKNVCGSGTTCQTGACVSTNNCVESSTGVCYKDDVKINFEPLTYATGNIGGQNGWVNTVPSTANVVKPPNAYGSSFGKQSLLITDQVTSGDVQQVLATPLADSVGETISTSAAFTTGTKYRNFEMQFDIGTSTPGTPQIGQYLSMSPDRGDGSRMSYLRFVQNTTGIVVMFDDVQGILQLGDPQCSECAASNPGCALFGPCANFVETIVTTLSTTSKHTIKLTLKTLDGPSNDVVKLYIDGKLVHTGTSWEDYYRYDVEAAPEPTPRIVKTMLFRVSGETISSPNGYLFDNIIMGAY